MASMQKYRVGVVWRGDREGRRNATHKVLKKPLASWTPLVAMISVPICAARPHRPSPLSRPIRGFKPAEPIHAIRIRLPVEVAQGYRQGDGRDKSKVGRKARGRIREKLIIDGDYFEEVIKNAKILSGTIRRETEKKYR
jgi:hypothetical protein